MLNILIRKQNFFAYSQEERKEPYKVLLLQEDGTQTTLMQILQRISKGKVEGAAWCQASLDT